MAAWLDGTFAKWYVFRSVSCSVMPDIHSDIDFALKDTNGF
jgi:hypothetical protein